jgi:ketosteroid isomerase-like protein
VSRENVEIVRRWVERFVATGEVLWADIGPEVEIRDHDTPDQETYRGHDGFRQWVADWEFAWADYRIEVQEVLDHQDLVVVVQRMTATGRSSGVQITRQDALVCGLDRGKVVRLDYYNDRAQALRAAGLE